MVKRTRGQVTRRAFLVGGMVGGGAILGGMVLGVGFLSAVDLDGLKASVRENGSVALNAWVEIRPDGQIIFAIPRTEMGQGVHTSLPMLIAEELEVSLDSDNVTVIHPTENLSAYVNFALALQKRPEDLMGVTDWLGSRVFGLVPFIGTGGSTSVVDAFVPLRRAGAVARDMLVRAAAERWGIRPSLIEARAGHLYEKGGERSVSYGDVAADAARLSPRKNIPLKPKANFKLIGKSQDRLDIPSKVTGQAEFGIDAQPEGLVYAVIKQSPVFGGRVESHNGADVEALPGIIKVVDIGDAVAVVGETTWHAKKGLKALEVRFDNQGNDRFDMQSIDEMLWTALEHGETHIYEQMGDVPDKNTGDVLEFNYETPYLAHACMEPMNCTAVIQNGKAELWSSSQVPLTMTWAAEQNADVDNVVGHTMLTGGGFGRRGENDVATQAVKIAKKLPGTPVKLIWSREEDIQHDMYRPAAKARIKARLGDDKLPSEYNYKVAVQSVAQDYSRRNLPLHDPALTDPANTEGAVHMPYFIPNRQICASVIDVPVPVGYWRSVGHSNNAFFMESAIDELAHAGGHDPLMLRKQLLKDHPRMTAIADRLEKLSEWAAPVKTGHGRGVALHPSFRSFVGQVVDVSVADDKTIRLERIVCVIDCGQAVNPDTVKAQMESGIIFGLTAAMFGKITIENGRVIQSNFPDYEMIQMHHLPDIHVEIIESEEAPGGVGEPGTPPIAPALTNAIFAATGERVRRLPLADSGYFFA